MPDKRKQVAASDTQHVLDSTRFRLARHTWGLWHNTIKVYGTQAALSLLVGILNSQQDMQLLTSFVMLLLMLRQRPTTERYSDA